MTERPADAACTPAALSSGVLCPDPLPPVLPRASVNLLAGAPGAGKTALLAWLTTRFRDQHPIFGFQPGPIPFQAFIGADRSWYRSTRKWFDAVGYSTIPHYSLQDDRGFPKSRLRKKTERIAILRTCLERVDDQAPGGAIPAGAIIWVDPLSVFLGGNLLDYDSCLVACSEIREICEERDITIIGTAHAGKQKADPKSRYLRVQDRIAGSTALFGYTDTQMYLAEPLEVGEDYSVFHWHPHHAAPGNFKLLRDPNTGLFLVPDDTVLAELPDPLLDPIRKEIDELMQHILAIVPESPKLTTANVIIRELRDREIGAARSTIYLALKRLMKDRQIVKVGFGHYTRPKPS